MTAQSSQKSERAWGWLTLALCLGLTALLYGATLSFPYLFDDPIHVRWLEGRSLARVWTNIKGLQHYRPLVMTLWALSERWLGAHNPLPLHLLTLAMHAANGWLAGALTRRLTGNRAAGLAAAVLLVTFPLSYQAMPSPGSQSKPLSTLLVLGACLLYMRGRSIAGGRRWAWLAGAILCAALAPFAYESAIVAGGFLIVVEWLLWRRREGGRFSPWSLLAVACGVPFLWAWRQVPSSQDAVSFPGWEALWQSSVYFLQAITWPLALAAKPLMRWTGLSDGIATAIVSNIAIVALVACAAWRKRLSLLFGAVAWVALSIGVQWATLPFRYIIDGPRMLYTASAGIALLWGELLGWAWERKGGWRAPARIAAALWLVGMAAWGTQFARVRMVLVADALRPLEQAIQHARAADPAERLLFINLPSWVAPEHTGLALGHEGYTLLPPYYGTALRDFVYVNTGVERTVRVEAYAPVRQAWRAPVGYYDEDVSTDALTEAIRQAERVHLLAYVNGRLELLYVGGSGEAAATDAPLAHMASVTLLAAMPSAEADGLTVDLTWRVEQTPGAPYTVFLHLYGPDGALIAQADGLPLGNTLAWTAWLPGQPLRDRRYVTAPEGTDLSRCTLGVGLYRTDNGERALATDARGAPLADSVYRRPAQ